MKKVIAGIIVVGLCIAGTANADLSSPVAYWMLDDPVGSGIVSDSSGNGLDGTFGAGVTLGEAGVFKSKEN